MPKVLLIHGSTCSVKYSFFRKRKNIFYNFDGFKTWLKSKNKTENQVKIKNQDEIESKIEAEIFEWSFSKQSLNFWQCISLYYPIKVYQDERKYTSTVESWERLIHKINREKPQILVAHSMGCEYLLKTINHLKKVPNSVKNIYLLNSDASKDFGLDFELNLPLENNQTVQIYNYHCFWDQALWCSVLINGRIPAGLFGCKESTGFQNQFWPLRIPITLNFHASMITNEVFPEQIMNSLKLGIDR